MAVILWRSILVVYICKWHQLQASDSHGNGQHTQGNKNAEQETNRKHPMRQIIVLMDLKEHQRQETPLIHFKVLQRHLLR